LINRINYLKENDAQYCKLMKLSGSGTYELLPAEQLDALFAADNTGKLKKYTWIKSINPLLCQ
jgi:hypothetical protein